jgi:signal transduction histidine kinase
VNAQSKVAKPVTEVDSEASHEAPKGPDQAALTEFFGSLAHDLRSPLGVVTQALGELQADFAASLTDEHRLLLNLADRGVRRLGRIADTVSLLSALESGSFDLKAMQPVDLFELVRDSVTAASAIEPRREVEVTCEIPEGPCLVAVDSERLSRAITEIMINAVRHARRKARLRIDLASGEARIAIEDDGLGVAPEWRTNLFRRFKPRPSRSGLGMGLSIAHDVIAAHHGQLTLEASTLPPGRPGTTGACFVISLPLPLPASA